MNVKIIDIPMGKNSQVGAGGSSPDVNDTSFRISVRFKACKTKIHLKTTKIILKYMMKIGTWF